MGSSILLCDVPTAYTREMPGVARANATYFGASVDRRTAIGRAGVSHPRNHAECPSNPGNADPERVAVSRTPQVLCTASIQPATRARGRPGRRFGVLAGRA